MGRPGVKVSVATSSPWACPHCRNSLHLPPGESFWVCSNKHQFDCAREGYVNLLPSHHKSSREPGDNAAMIAARKRVHAADVYLQLAQAVQEQLLALPEVSAVLDLGCGEGYYSRAMARALPLAQVCGIDISRAAVRLAAKQQKAARFAVASSYHLPLLDNSQQLILRLFAPSDDAEVVRVLQPGGIYLEVTPATRHLWELRRELYDTPTEHEPARISITGMQLLKQVPCNYAATLGQQLLADLISMTPYAHRSPRQRREAVSRMDSLRVSMSFSLNLFQLG
jgi:23S rRNA (guanine745-N1)-methyltransferase